MVFRANAGRFTRFVTPIPHNYRMLKLSPTDKLDPPIRDISAPLRIPISNVFKRQSSGAAVSGRLCGGVIQVGETLRVLPGDETTIVKCEMPIPYKLTRTT